MLIIDRYEKLGSNYSYISQNFESAVYKGLLEIKTNIQAFKEMILFYKKDSDYPVGTLIAFKRFTAQYKIPCSITSFYIPGTVQKNKVYFIIDDMDLWELLQDCQKQNFVLGKDIGIITQDDTPAKALILGGITTISTDFRLMAQKSAEFVLNRTKIQKIIPGQLIRRNSL